MPMDDCYMSIVFVCLSLCLSLFDCGSSLCNRLKDRKTERQKDRKTERQKDRKTERQKDRKTERQKDKKTERQKDKKAVRFGTLE